MHAKPLKFRVLISFLLLGLTLPAGAEDNYSDSTRFLLRIFSICIQTVGDPAAIEKLLVERGQPKLSAEQASGFLGGASGSAWPADMPFGKYVFSSRADGLCAVHAQRANVKELEQAFLAMLEQMRASAGGTLIKDFEETAANGRHVVSYNFGPPTPEDFYVNVAISTLDSKKTQLQALLTYGIVRTAIPGANKK